MSVFYNLTFLCVYKRFIFYNCNWFRESDDYYLFKKDNKIFYLDKKNTLLLNVKYVYKEG